jgi:hypothetical protein
MSVPPRPLEPEPPSTSLMSWWGWSLAAILCFGAGALIAILTNPPG